MGMPWSPLMEYFVIGADGNEYGPASAETLQQWAQQSRVLPSTMLKNVATGERLPASSVPGIFPPQAPYAGQVGAYPPPSAAAQYPGNPYQNGPSAGQYPGNGYQGAQYPRPGAPAPGYSAGQDNGIFFRSLMYSGMSLVFVFLLGGIGIFSACYSLYYAIRSQREGHSHGFIAIIVAAITLIIAGARTAMRVSHMG